MTARELKTVWENLGRVDPLWAVMSSPEHRHGKWDLDDFMATGRDSVGYLAGLVESNGMSFGDRVLDFGCGVGRMSNVLAEQGFQVVGVDIAASMVERARELNAYPDRLTFVSYDGGELPFPDDSFDSAVTLIVLQHCPPAEQVAAIMQLQRVVRPGGVLVFQIPSRPAVVEPLDEPARCAEIGWLSDLAELPAGSGGSVAARVTNRGDRVWPAGAQVRLANHWYRGDDLVTWDDGRADLPGAVAPGESVEVELAVTAPPAVGEYRLELDVVQEFVAWWSESGTRPVSHPVRVSESMAEQPAEAVSEGTPEAEVVGGMEMHGMPVELVTGLLTHCGHEVVAVVPDSWPGPEWESFTYVVRIA